MENVFYQKDIVKTYDLKGSKRNRYAEGEAVAMDENVIEFLFDRPFYVRRETKNKFNQAVGRDTHFLAKMNIMDYSLIMGLDGTGNMYIGIIDILRTWTWDKKLETIVKKSGILGNNKEQPTVPSPREYCERFRKALDDYLV